MGKITKFAIAVLIIILVTGSQADVVIQSKSSVNTMGLMNADVESYTYVKGDKSAMENTTKVKGGMMAMFGDMPDQKSIEIDRLDKGVSWDVDVNEQTYSERQLASLKQDMMDESAEDEGDMLGDVENYDWELELKTDEGPIDINGFECRGIIATAKGVSKEDPEEKTDLYFEYWYSGDVEGYDELKAFDEKYSEITGMEMIEAQAEIGQMFARFGDEFQDMFDKMETAEGYPIKTVLTIKGSQREMPEGEEESDEGGMPPGMMEMMKGMMGGGEESEDGMTTTISVVYEVLSIKTKAVDDSKFEVPEGFEKY